MTAYFGTFVAQTSEVNGRTFDLVVDETDRSSSWQCLTCKTYVGCSSDGMADHDCQVKVCVYCGSHVTSEFGGWFCEDEQDSQDEGYRCQSGDAPGEPHEITVVESTVTASSVYSDPAVRQAISEHLAAEPVCPTCDGEREVEQRHPMWGNINCPDPTITVPCPDCMGIDPDGDAR